MNEQTKFDKNKLMFDYWNKHKFWITLGIILAVMLLFIILYNAALCFGEDDVNSVVVDLEVISDKKPLKILSRDDYNMKQYKVGV